MNDLIFDSTMTPGSVMGLALKTLEKLDANALLVGGGILCFTAIACFACVCFSGSEMTISKDGLSISQPAPAV